MNKKTTLACVLAFCFCISGCSFFGQGEDGVLYKNKTNETASLTVGQEIEFKIDKEVQSNNFLTMDLSTDCNLLGYIHYTKTEDPATAHQEKIYIEAGATDFSMFLDAFRIGAFGAYEKTIEKITLKNVDKEAGSVKVNQIDISNRTYNNQEMLYTQNEYLKIGASLAAGGSLCHVESLGRDVVEYIDREGFVRIEENVDQDAVKADMGKIVTDQVNMVNVYDLGREIQQSFYAHVSEEDGYAPDDDILYEGHFSYNPVQAGSAGDNQSQIIDYHVDENGIYVKCRPQDWFLRNTQTDSYMESTYTFNEDGTLRVTNRFVNFAGFKNMESAYFGGQETPAIYIVHPLNYFYCETASGVIHDPKLLGAMDTQSKTSADHEVIGDYHYTLRSQEVPNDWFAFVNEKKFGLGIYMPKMDSLVASRGYTSTYYLQGYNSEYNADIYNLSVKRIPSMYVSNYNYCCPSVIRQMVDYVPFEYTFALYVGTVSEMKDTFAELKKDKEIPNDGIEAWETRDF